jgi:catechol 2,3-dioxygenase-like lactoylglutathione lyase family enzyme
MWGADREPVVYGVRSGFRVLDRIFSGDRNREETVNQGGAIMKRLHIHVGVVNLDEAVRFYSTLFGADPIKRKPDYAKWLLDDPWMNFAISTRAQKTGIDHLGIQVEDEAELTELRERLKAGDTDVVDEGETVCCYARSEKSWIQDPAGIPWEAYRTMEDAQVFSGQANSTDGACCTPETKGQPDCCEPSEKTAGCCG